MKFELSEKEYKKAYMFKKTCEEFNMLRSEPHQHLTFEYRFILGLVGTTAIVVCNELDAKQDVTDYEKW